MEAAVLRKQAETLLQKLEEAKSGRALDEQARTAAESKAQAAEAVSGERLVTVPVQYRDIKALEQAISFIESRITALGRDLEKARKKATDAGSSLAQAQAQYDERKGVAERADNAWENSEKEKRLRILEIGFADEAEYVTAVRNKEARWNLDRLIRDFDGRMAAAQERLNRAVQAAGQIAEVPDIAAMEAVYDVANAREQELRVEEGRIRDRLVQARSLIARFAEHLTTMSAAEDNHALYAGLHEIASGRFTGVSFERYVLGFLLDEVSLYANLRLKEMTRGRYRLRRRENREDKRKGAGLDLEVLDGYTGEARPVQTLSGGETFLASLSLAFGLADVVQSRSGGIHLDTLFVDEGFGTLDPETLDLAVKALRDLQQGGRLVGIISHVPELREIIDARLEIIPVDRGSRAEFHVG
jgi:exonuclease SbcC